VARIDLLREATRGLTLREIIDHMLQASGLIDFYRTDKEGQDRIENLEELVNAAEAFVTQEGFGKDAVALPVDEQGGAGASGLTNARCRRRPWPPAPCRRRMPRPARSCRRWPPS
jgi:DNA helicase II / ATP-dependent DNA helicase PcrA